MLADSETSKVVHTSVAKQIVKISQILLVLWNQLLATLFQIFQIRIFKASISPVIIIISNKFSIFEFSL